MNQLLVGLSIFFCLGSISFADDATAVQTRPYTVKFIDEMTAHHKDGVGMADVAIEKSYHSELKVMAEKMKMAQEMEIKTMQNWRQDWYPTAPHYEYQGTTMDMEKLMKLSGNAFDVAFLDSMIMHHGGAIFLGEEAHRRSEKSAVRVFGKKIARDQYKEVLKMRMLRDLWAK